MSRLFIRLVKVGIMAIEYSLLNTILFLLKRKFSTQASQFILFMLTHRNYPILIIKKDSKPIFKAKPIEFIPN